MSKPRCGDCLNYDPGDECCHFHAPQPAIAVDGQKYVLVKPKVGTNDWCMEGFTREIIGGDGNVRDV